MKLLPYALPLLLASCSSPQTIYLYSDASSPGDPLTQDEDGGVVSHVDSSVPLSDGAVLTPTTNIRIIVEPSDKGAALVAAIKGAKTSVHMTMYLITSNEIANALIAQHKAKHGVLVLLDQNGIQSSNQPIFDSLTQAGVPVKWAPTGFTFTHEKCVILDGTEAWIMTMNATNSSATDNREYLAIDDDAADVAEVEAIFQADYAGQSITPTGSLLVAPVNARAGLVALVSNAKKTIDIEAEEMSDTAFITALGNAVMRGVTVHMVLSDATPSASQTTAIPILKKDGVNIVQLATPYIHAKSMVIDGTTAFVGSENFSGGSLGYNREVGVVFSVPSEVEKVLTATTADFTAGTPM